VASVPRFGRLPPITGDLTGGETTPTYGSGVANYAPISPGYGTSVRSPGSENPPSGPAPVATGGASACGEKQFWDGTHCRGSVDMPGGLANIPGGLTASGGSAAGLMPAPSMTDISAASLLGQVRLVMGHRFPLLAGHSRLGMIPLVGIRKTGFRPMPLGIGPGPESKRPDGIGQGFVLPSSTSAKPLDTSTSMWSVLGIAGAVGVAVYLVLR
jgi:hypothetical protein